MCQIASSVDRWIRHLRVSRIKSLSRAVGIKKNRRGKAFEVSIICSPHWNQTKYGEDQSSSPYTFRRLCLSQKGISLTKTNERFRILCMGPSLRHVPAHCIHQLHHCIALCNETEIAKKYKNQRTRRNTQKSFVFCYFSVH